MPDLATNVMWREILRETEAGNIPHCRAISAPLKWHDDIMRGLADLILGGYRPSHPDLLIAGTPDKAPLIGDITKPNYEGSCRWMIENIALKPLESKRRLGVIFCADNLGLPAANSLLKLAEEPPSHAYLLFLMEDGRLFLPTLRSRSRFNTIISGEHEQPRRIPSDAAEWVSWLNDSRKSGTEIDAVISDFEAWSDYALQTGNIELAERIEKLRIIASRRNLSIPQLCDITILALREENTYIERLLDDFRQA